jgi:TRAP-type transport system periplasmic protein
MKRLLTVLLITLLIASVILGACAKASTPASTAPAKTTAPVTSQAAKQITLVFSSFDPPNGTWQVYFFDPWFAEIEKRSGGRVKIEDHWGGELAGMMDSYDAAVKGTVDIAHFLPGALVGRFPGADIASFSPSNIKVYRPDQVLWDLYEEFPEISKAYNQAKLLFLGISNATQLGSSKKDVKTLDDVKGYKITSLGEWSSEKQKALGMVPVSVPPADVTTSLERGVIDGMSLAWCHMWDWGWGNAMKHLSGPMTPSGQSTVGVAMNLSKFNSLPPDIQKIFTDLIPWSISTVEKMLYDQDKMDKDKAIKDFGTIYSELPKSELDKLAVVDAQVLDKYVASLNSSGFPGDKLKSEFLKLCTKYSASEYIPK